MTTPLSIRIARLTAMADGAGLGIFEPDKVEVREDDLRALIAAHAQQAAEVGRPRRWADVDLDDSAARTKQTMRLTREIRLYLMYSRRAGQDVGDCITSLHDAVRDEWERLLDEGLGAPPDAALPTAGDST